MFFICQTVVNGNYDYKFVPETKTWYEARDYCRDTFDDLAVTKDEAAVNVSVYQRNFPVWTGLRRDGKHIPLYKVQRHNHPLKMNN